MGQKLGGSRPSSSRVQPEEREWRRLAFLLPARHPALAGELPAFMRERKGFEKSVSILTPLQLRVLQELAASPKARVFGAEFLRRVGMANAGAVSKAIKRLQDHDLIYEINGEHRFGDSFFRQWILRSV